VQVKSNPTTTKDQDHQILDVNDSAPGRVASISQETALQDKSLLKKRFVLFFCVATLTLLADLVSKTVVFSSFFDPTQDFQVPHFWIDGIFGIQTSTNPGALFGMGSGYSWLFAILSLFALSGIMLWLFVFGAGYDLFLTLTLGLISGGIMGNLYDRLGWGALPSYPESIRTNVRDFILFRLEGVPFFDPWPNFNLADCWLVCGAALLFFHALFLAPPDDVSAAPEKDAFNVN
jgi:signal peptidase II